MSERVNKFMVAAYELSKSNPAGWDKFLQMLGHYTQEKLEDAVKKSNGANEQVGIGVGMGRQALIFFEEMRDLEVFITRTSKVKGR